MPQHHENTSTIATANPRKYVLYSNSRAWQRSFRAPSHHVVISLKDAITTCRAIAQHTRGSCARDANVTAMWCAEQSGAASAASGKYDFVEYGRAVVGRQLALSVAILAALRDENITHRQTDAHRERVQNLQMQRIDRSDHQTTDKEHGTIYWKYITWSALLVLLLLLLFYY